MRIFNKHLEGLSILSCCTLLEDHPSPSKNDFSVLTIPQQLRYPVHDSKIENNQPRPIPAPLPEPRRRSLSKEKEWLTRTKSIISFMSTSRNISGLRDMDSDRFSHVPTPSSPSSTSQSPTSTVFHQLRNENLSATKSVFQPLCLRFSKSENEWESVLSQVCNQMSPAKLNEEEKLLSVAGNSDSTKSVFPTSDDSVLASDQLDMTLMPDKILYWRPELKKSTHVRVHSEPAAFERIKMALDESYKLTQRLKDLEDDIERKSIYLGSRPGTPVSSKGNGFPEIPELPHPLKSAPTHPFRRPGTRSFSLNSNSVRPDWGTPLPPLPLMLQPSISKKEKTMSRVSSWLISSNQNENENARLSNSITNTPRPVTDRDGFYQCLEPPQETSGTPTSASDCFSDQPTIWTCNYSSPAFKSDLSTPGLGEDFDQRRKSLEEIVQPSNLSKKIQTNRSGLQKIDTGIAY
ncbi:hypothetical protein EPUL_005969 [Erysiphe pulchra]|uniref:Uncharacterized protein n=1 Tax=Erysiphe pulchra TaxID=225359 RepID=A0A2S4PLB7_9PEZI|nr:hypothetical protein EPUL_005969 [Erysiphe pulchra]